jgi:hypothetical protein
MNRDIALMFYIKPTSRDPSSLMCAVAVSSLWLEAGTQSEAVLRSRVGARVQQCTSSLRRQSPPNLHFLTSL